MFDRRAGEAPGARWEGRLAKDKEFYDSDLMKVAAFQGSIETMKWLRSQDRPCPWDKYECRTAAETNGEDNIVRWIDEEP